MAINGTEQLSNLSREGKQNDLPTPTAAEKGASTLHNQSSDKNNPALPYTGPAPLKFQNPLVDSKLDADEVQTTPTATAQAASTLHDTVVEQKLSTLHDITSADNIPPLPYKGPAPLKFQRPSVSSNLYGESALTVEKYLDNLPK